MQKFDKKVYLRVDANVGEKVDENMETKVYTTKFDINLAQRLV